ncbi:extra spindle pole bodies like 1, separase [Rhynchophorus ferrugineus]|uniref:separase n=1 Tax=Rhynchophorus ferrugineus TaxID=354439 RepID=A0A834IJC7_RHYFE|nr:hypothetical protein GWI33_006280 [Rhynchophorus ferrugineus]
MEHPEHLLKVEDILKELDSISNINHIARSGLAHQRSQKFKADMCTDDELSQIYCLVDSHVPTLRERAAMRYERLLSKSEVDEETANQLKFLKDIILTKCPSNINERIQEIMKQVYEMPKEWTLIQLTSQHTPAELQNLNAKKFETNGIYITVFNCGQNEFQPFMVKADKPTEYSNKIELIQEVVALISANKERLMNNSGRKNFKNYREKMEYCRDRDRVDENMSILVDKMEKSWLKHWRCLFIGKYQNNEIETYIQKSVENYLKNEQLLVKSRCLDILYRVVKGAYLLDSYEIEDAIEYCLESNDKLVLNKFSNFLLTLNKDINSIYKDISRHPVILIVDECLDCLPWEMMQVLRNQPVSRLPSFHFVYLLFKTHEKDIEDGHKIIRNYNSGAYIVNPDRNLDLMERRMMCFYKYWVSDWHGIHDRKPTNDEFISMLTDTEIFLYNGHGNGAHIMSVDSLQRKYVKAVVMLFGCGSIRINKLGPQTEMYSSYHMYLISRCPCVVGMLWEVTDIDTDVLTAEFISNWIPSKASIHWSNLDKASWTKGIDSSKFVPIQQFQGRELNNPELLRALCHSKNTAKYYMTKAACVVRGLPVKIK